MQRKTFETTDRAHIGLQVEELERSIAFYRVLFGLEPAEVRADYARFEPAQPALILSLNRSATPAGSAASSARRAADHFGIQVGSSKAVLEAERRLRRAGIAARLEQQNWCCYAVQDKVWADDPDGNPWEVFVVLQSGVARPPGAPASDCCAPATEPGAACCASGASEPDCCAAG